REHSAARSGATPFEQVIGQVFDVRSQIAFFDLCGGHLGVARFAQQRAIFRHYFIEGRAGRGGRGRATASPATTGGTTATACTGAFFSASFFLRASFGAPLHRKRVGFKRPDEAETDHEDE